MMWFIDLEVKKYLDMMQNYFTCALIQNKKHVHVCFLYLKSINQ